MPIKWSAVRVSDNVDEIEELMNSVRPTLWRIREKAKALFSLTSITRSASSTSGKVSLSRVMHPAKSLSLFFLLSKKILL